MAAILSTTFAQPATAQTAVWTLASVTGVQKGYVCVAEGEYAQVLQVGPGLTVKVLRGSEATAAAAHATSTPVAVYRSHEVETGEPIVSAAAVSLRQASVTLTDAQIKALPTTGALVVAAAGANTVIVPTQVVVRLDIVTGGEYVSSADATWLLAWKNGSNYSYATAPQLMHNVLDGGPTSLVIVFPAAPFLSADILTGVVTSNTSAAIANAVNMPLVIKDDWNGVLDYTGGNADNTASVSLTYHVLNVSSGLFV